jgi:hypothetical protein
LAVCYYCGIEDSCVEEEAADKDCNFPVVHLAAVEAAVEDAVEDAVEVVVEVAGE